MRGQLEKGKVFVNNNQVMTKEEIQFEIENLKQVEHLLGNNRSLNYLEQMELHNKFKAERERLEQLIKEIEG